MKKKLLILFILVFGLFSLASCGGNSGNEYDKDGRLILELRNLYFTDWAGGDSYTNYIQDKFNVSIVPTNYSWADWDNQVSSAINGDNLTDVFNFDVDSYNFANTYERWVKGGDIRSLPDDLSKWPNLKAVIEKTSNIDAFKIDGKLYGIPVVKNIDQMDADYSPFTYVYRRDWAKELGVYKENDVYTWTEFQNLLRAFYDKKCSGDNAGNFYALADVEWGYPSILNFYKNVPHCFDIKDGVVVPTYTTPEYLEGLELVKSWSLDKSPTQYYGYAQYSANDGDVSKQFIAGRVGVFYENLTLSNYTDLRKRISERSEVETMEQLDDRTAIMKVSGPDGKYHLEGNENWFGITLFKGEMSDEKMEKILDIMDWLLTEEGTMMAIYGIEGYDYEIVDGEVVLSENGWELDMNGNYIEKNNGAKYLRYMVTLSNDTADRDPLIDKKALQILNDWYDFMDTQKVGGNLKILVEDTSVKWLTTPTKALRAGGLLTNGVADTIQYTYGKITLDEFKAKFTQANWVNVLKEINDALKK